MKKYFIGFYLVIWMIPNFLFAQSNMENLLLNGWHESPHESDPANNVLAFRLNKYLPVPGIDVNPDFSYCGMDIQVGGVLQITSWRWCGEDATANGKWSQKDNTLQFSFGNCMYKAVIQEIRKDFLLLRFDKL